jgi:cleavage and polyadenylation specificity factor subunit 1
VFDPIVGTIFLCGTMSVAAAQGAVSLASEAPSEFESVLVDYPEVLVKTLQDADPRHGMEHHVITEGPPVAVRARWLDLAKLAAAKAAFRDMESMGVYLRSPSPWSSPLHMVPKLDSSWRPCGDYRALNTATVVDRYSLPHIMDFAAGLEGCMVFSKLDLMRGYHQVDMAADSVAKTAVITPFGMWEFPKMPFGLRNVAQCFQRLMDRIFGTSRSLQQCRQPHLSAAHSCHPTPSPVCLCCPKPACKP